jgi:NAD(P)-dependent dehydrogenase (short-subunit alcohol dehydrogenase family)
METVLVVGATGNIGVSAVKAVLDSGRRVLAVVRNQDSAKKLFQHVGTQEGISTVEADILSEHGIQGVVEEVENGRLPAFQHVYGAGVQLLDASSVVSFWLM